MADRLSRIFLWLFVMNLGVALGAGLYESRIVVTEWLSETPDSGLHWDADAARRDDTGVRFWVYVTTVPLTLLTLANLIVAWRSALPARAWWRAAAVVALLERTFTFSYFIPRMVGLIEAPDSPASVSAATAWISLNHLRHVMLLTAWVAALKAFSLVYAGGSRGGR